MTSSRINNLQTIRSPINSLPRTKCRKYNISIFEIKVHNQLDANTVPKHENFGKAPSCQSSPETFYSTGRVGGRSITFLNFPFRWYFQCTLLKKHWAKHSEQRNPKFWGFCLTWGDHKKVSPQVQSAKELRKWVFISVGEDQHTSFCLIVGDIIGSSSAISRLSVIQAWANFSTVAHHTTRKIFQRMNLCLI